jgi:hypothetical protein
MNKNDITDDNDDKDTGYGTLPIKIGEFNSNELKSHNMNMVKLGSFLEVQNINQTNNIKKQSGNAVDYEGERIGYDSDDSDIEYCD